MNKNQAAFEYYRMKEIILEICALVEAIHSGQLHQAHLNLPP